MGFKFNEHPELIGRHAFLAPSKPGWRKWSDDDTIDHFMKADAAARGTEIHEFAASCIRRGEDGKLFECGKTLNLYVNDAIGFRLKPEVPLCYSRDISHGTADAISFENGVLRIHDLKTGETPAHMTQLENYVALFCLEYKIDPRDIKVETRIYQNGEIIIDIPNQQEIRDLMEDIIHKVGLVEKYKRENGM